jgi:hypothetical protein
LLQTQCLLYETRYEMSPTLIFDYVQLGCGLRDQAGSRKNELVQQRPRYDKY